MDAALRHAYAVQALAEREGGLAGAAQAPRAAAMRLRKRRRGDDPLDRPAPSRSRQRAARVDALLRVTGIGLFLHVQSCWRIAKFFQYDFLIINCILMKLHRLCCLVIGQCARCCDVGWYWLLIHMIIHNPCTPFVDTVNGGSNVPSHYCLTHHGV